MPSLAEERSAGYFPLAFEQPMVAARCGLHVGQLREPQFLHVQYQISVVPGWSSRRVQYLCAR